jgi:hypothetical protein
MGFLTPLFLAGLAAISVPVLLHMLRRTPKGRVLFSTLMFLEPSPPRVTKRSRIQHWLLLILRGLAVTLLALAFARPYLRSSDSELTPTPLEQTAVLIDISASMQRDGLWEQARQIVEQIIADAPDNQPLALLTFDRELHPLIRFDEWQTLQPGVRRDVLRQKLQSLQPGWLESRLGRVLPQAAALTTITRQESSTAPMIPLRLIVVSDLQRGNRLEGLQSFDWPAQVRVELHPVGGANAHGAGLQLAGLTEDNHLRLRIENSSDSPHERFQLAVMDEHGTKLMPATGAAPQPRSPASSEAPDLPHTEDIVIPPGESRIVRRAIPVDPQTGQPPSALRIELKGDATPFDNIVWFVPPQPVQARVEYLGPGTPDDAQQLRYYLERAFVNTPRREVAFAETGEEVHLTIVARPLLPDELTRLRTAVEKGRRIVCVGTSIELCQQAFELAALPRPAVTEAATEGFALLSEIDYRHPLFEPFQEARHADFSKLPIWKHRDIALPELPAPEASRLKILARLDEGRPAVLELAGTVTLFSFGWVGDDSRLVLSTRFVPLLNALLDSAVPEPVASLLSVGDPLPAKGIKAITLQSTVNNSPAESLPVPATGPLTASRPGLYRIESAAEPETAATPKVTSFAVNLAPDESRTEPLGADEFKALGVPLDSRATESASAATDRQLQVRELESRQRLWQWLLLIGILLLLLETWLAGRLSRTEPVNHPGAD